MLKLTVPYFSVPKDRALEKVLNTLRGSIENSFRELNRCPILTGSLIADEALAIGSNDVYHKLGRIPTGYLIINISGAASNIYTSNMNEGYITFVSSAVCAASFWIF